MSLRGRKYFIRPVAAALMGLTLTGCITPTADKNTGRYTAPIGDAPVITNETPYSTALHCMNGYTTTRPVHVAVGQIADYTGKFESDNSGRKVTQGAALMAMSALAKAGVPLVERFDTSVAEMELKYANNKLISADGLRGSVGGSDYRKIYAGSIPGSDYYLVGGITELNLNIRSMGANADGGETATDGIKATGGVNLYVMNVGLDLRLVDTNTLEVVDVISYQKQIIGRQISAGVFDFLGQHFFDASVGESALEPIQLAVRSVIERAVLEMVSRLYRTPQSACTARLGTADDPLAGPGDHRVDPAAQANATKPATVPAAAATTAPAKLNTTANSEEKPDASRKNAYRYYSSNDPDAGLGLRGGH
jgi:curli production assembly/transport component CsgG/holdfast attachment protein HfaB